MKWLTLVIEKDSEGLLQILLPKTDKTDLLSLNWIFCILSNYRENMSERDYGIENDMLKSFTEKVCSSTQIQDGISKLITQYNTIEELELALGVIHSMSSINMDVKNCFDMLMLAEHWQKLYLEQKTTMNAVSMNVVQFMGLANSRYADALSQVNSLLDIRPSRKRKAKKNIRHETFDDVFVNEEKEVMANDERDSISGKNVLEKILNLDTSKFNPVSDNNVAKKFSLMNTRILESILEQFFVHQPYSEEVIELLFQGADRRLMDGTLDIKYIKRIAEKLKWMLINVVTIETVDGRFKGTYGKLDELNRNIRDRALSNLTANLLYRRRRNDNKKQKRGKGKKQDRGKKSNSVMDDNFTTESEIFSGKSVLSELIQLGWPNSHWAEQEPKNWSWRSRGHTFWNNTKLERKFNQIHPVERFNVDKEFNPELYVNSLTLKGLIELHHLLKKIENWEIHGSSDYIVDIDISMISNYFLEGGDPKSSTQMIILNQLLSPVPKGGKSDLNSLIRAFADAILSEPAIYHAHINDKNTSTTKHGTPLKPNLKSRHNNQYIIPHTVLNDEILRGYRCNVREMDIRLSQSLLQKAYSDKVAVSRYFSIDSSGNYIDDDSKVDSRIKIMKKEVGMILRKHFENMNKYQELILLSNILNDICENEKFESVNQFKDWMNEVLMNQVHKIELFDDEKEPLQSESQIYRNAAEEYLIDSHTVSVQTNFSEQRFSKYFKLLNDILDNWNDEKISWAKIQHIFDTNFKKNSIFEVTGLHRRINQPKQKQNTSGSPSNKEEKITTKQPESIEGWEEKYNLEKAEKEQLQAEKERERTEMKAAKDEFEKQVLALKARLEQFTSFDEEE